MKENENYEYTFWDKFLSKLNWGLWLFISLIALIFGFVGHANAMTSGTRLPYYSSYIDNDQPYFAQNSDSLQTILDYYSGTIQTNNLQNYAIIIHYNSETSSNYIFTSFLLYGPTVSNLNAYDSSGNSIQLSEFSDIYSDYFILTYNSRSFHPWKVSKTTGVLSSNSSSNNIVTNPCIFGNSSITNPGLKYCYPIYIKGELKLNDVTIFKEGSPGIVLPVGGDPSVFDDTGLNIDSSLTPATVPTAPSSYSVTFPTAPTWDSSSPVQSVFDYLIWGFSCLNVLLQGVIDKLSEWIAFVGSLLSYLVQKILDYLKAIVEWFYAQFLAWLTPYLKILQFIQNFLFDESLQLSVIDVLNAILDKLDNLFAGTFFEDIWDWFNDNYVTPSLTNLYNIVDAIDKIRILFTADSQPIYLRGAFFDSYLGQFMTQGRRLGVGLLEIFQNIQTPDSLIFAVDFGELPLGHSFRDVGIIYIDFSWYAGIRTVIQTLFVTCLYVGVGFTLFFKIPNIINGSQGLDSMFGVTFTTTPYDGVNQPMPHVGQSRIETRGFTLKGGPH